MCFSAASDDKQTGTKSKFEAMYVVFILGLAPPTVVRSLNAQQKGQQQRKRHVLRTGEWTEQ
jgi:hypothetical protein